MMNGQTITNRGRYFYACVILGKGFKNPYKSKLKFGVNFSIIYLL